MAITDNSGVHFSEAHLVTANDAHLDAELGTYSRSFRVSLEDDEGYSPAKGWHFTENACREAAEFFTKLADELKRRAEAE